jgi:hypothetical protein
MMIYYLNIVTSLHFTSMFDSKQVLRHIIFFYNTTAVTEDIIIRF